MLKRTPLHLPINKERASCLRAGELLTLSGTVYTARDAAHKRMVETLERGEALPFPLQDATIYYAGPCPPRPGQVIGSAGPTTSGRMDAYTPLLLQHGLRIMIGKGLRKPAVIVAMQQYGAVYLGATGGAGALLARHIVATEIVAWPDLGPEAVRRLTLERFPAIVLIDSQGNNLYTSGVARYSGVAAEDAAKPSGAPASAEEG